MKRIEVRSANPSFVSALAICLPVTLALGAAFAPLSPSDYGVNSSRARGLAQLSAEIVATQKPVVSDDMVLLIRSGQEVLWEPAIFAELAKYGRLG